MSDGGKGSAPRPFSVPRETFERNWEQIFQKKEPAEPTPKEKVKDEQ